MFKGVDAHKDPLAVSKPYFKVKHQSNLTQTIIEFEYVQITKVFTEMKHLGKMSIEIVPKDELANYF